MRQVLIISKQHETVTELASIIRSLGFKHIDSASDSKMVHTKLYHNPPSVITVSYTHLDVYKRQAGDFGRIHTRKENFCCLFLRKTAGLRYHQILGRILQYIPIPFIDRYCVTKKGGKGR